MKGGKSNFREAEMLQELPPIHPRGAEALQGTSADPSSEDSGHTVITDTIFPEGGGSRALIPEALQTALDLAGPSRSWLP